MLTDADTHDLAYYSKYLLCAAYLASYNPARLDPIYFMKSSEKKRKRRGGGGGASGRVAKHRKVLAILLIR
jgi:origin recognition complex subunit 5